MNSVLAFFVGLVLGPIVAVVVMALAFVCMVLWHCNRRRGAGAQDLGSRGRL